jgi:hypothetical protein
MTRLTGISARISVRRSHGRRIGYIGTFQTPRTARSWLHAVAHLAGEFEIPPVSRIWLGAADAPVRYSMIYVIASAKSSRCLQ